jgi:hypothetical protein
MSGPNDSGSGDTPTGDFKLQVGKTDDVKPAVRGTEPQTPSPRFRLRLDWDTPQLQWRPLRSAPLRGGDEPEFLALDDPFEAVLRTERYIATGGLLFDMRTPSFEVVDKAFLDAPTEPPKLLPSFAQMKAWQDDAFYKGLGRTPPLFGAPAPQPLYTPPLLAPPPPSPFYKAPDPAAMRGEPTAPKAGAAGDILKAFMGLPIVQIHLNKLTALGLQQVRLLKRDWDEAPWRDRITAITLAAPLAAGVVGAVLRADEARHFAFKSLKGVDVPVPWVPGLSVHVSDYGKADPFLLGAKSGEAHQAQAAEFGLKLDLLKAIPVVRRVF